MVLGATPGLAVGPHLSAAVRWSWFSVGLDARVAWGLGKMELAPGVRISSWALNVPICLHYKPAFVCAVGQVDWLDTHHLDLEGKVGFGGRVGAEFAVRAPFGLRAWFDVIGRPQRPSVYMTETPFRIWESSTVTGAFGLAGVVTF